MKRRSDADEQPLTPAKAAQGASVLVKAKYEDREYKFVDYDYLKLKGYEFRICSDGSVQKLYMLSFNEKQHLKVSEVAKKIMDCFDGKKTLNQIQSELNLADVNCTHEDLVKFVDDILVKNSILDGMDDIIQIKKKSYMWFHFPIIDSNKLSWLFRLLKVLYTKWAYIPLLTLILICGSLSVYHIVTQGMKLNSVNSIGIILLMYASLAFHEFGHVTAAYKQNVRVGHIGIGMYLFNPVFYVDMTNTWRLSSKGRVLVDVGGMYFQLITIIPLTLIGLVTQNEFIYVINTSIMLLTIMNLIPFIKLDGYWILCDYLELDNISINAFGIVMKVFKQAFSRNKSGLGMELLNKKHTKAYITASFVYVFSTLIMVFAGLVLAIKLLVNFNIVIQKMVEIYHMASNGDLAAGLALLNQTFVLVLPVFFLAYMIFQLLINVIKKRKKEVSI